MTGDACACLASTATFETLKSSRSLSHPAACVRSPPWVQRTSLHRLAGHELPVVEGQRQADESHRRVMRPQPCVAEILPKLRTSLAQQGRDRRWGLPLHRLSAFEQWRPAGLAEAPGADEEGVVVIFEEVQDSASCPRGGNGGCGRSCRGRRGCEGTRRAWRSSGARRGRQAATCIRHFARFEGCSETKSLL